MKMPCLLGPAWPTLALGLLLTACAPSYYLTVQPAEPAGKDQNGRQALFAALDSVETVVSFSHQRDQQVLFDVEVRNGSGRPILVDPAQFYYEPAVSQAVASTTAGVGFLLARVPAVDPELQLQKLSGQLATEDRKATGTSGWEWLTIVSDVTADLTASKRKETPKQEYERKLQYDRDMRSYDYSRAQHAETADRTALEADLWQHKMLRRYELQPGELMRGYVVFPALDQSVQLRLGLPLGPHRFTFAFDQQRKEF
jgi:hypothetical protein